MRICRGTAEPAAQVCSERLRTRRRSATSIYAAQGETIVCAIEFGPTQQARCTLGYGNASQPGSKHLEDQLPLMVQKTLHPVWRERKDVEAHLEKKESF